MEIFIPIVIILFVFSLISERLANFLKLNLPEVPDHQKVWGVFPGGPLRTKSEDEACEKIRERRVFILAFISGVAVSFAAKANLFSMLRYMDEANKTLWWQDEYGINNFEEAPAEIFFGCLLTALFISLGSKFWHDLLDMLCQVKNYKRILADPDTYRVDNIESFDKLLTTYQSDFITAAFLEAKSKFTAMENVKAISLEHDGTEYYFKITVKNHDPDIPYKYQFFLDDGTPQNIKIKMELLGGDDIVAHFLDLSGRVFEANPADFGTVGCLVKPKGDTIGKLYFLTCSHNVLSPPSRVTSFTPNTLVLVNTDEPAATPIGKVEKAVHDHEIDAALIEVDPAKRQQIMNTMPQKGAPNKARTLVKADTNKVQGFMFGAGSNTPTDGTVISVYADPKIKYGNKEFQFINLIKLSKNGLAISRGGDSGSVVFDSNNNIIGLVVGGNSRETYAMPIDTLLAKLNVELA